ncbi:hypothetical protein ABE493_00965 [Stenotrophomonas terrae]|uniref:hypothetical protein n=1 Tax=Stenotrophomonas terrae TaxID=405446 RepID=UPI003207FE25
MSSVVVLVEDPYATLFDAAHAYATETSAEVDLEVRLKALLPTLPSYEPRDPFAAAIAGGAIQPPSHSCR